MIQNAKTGALEHRVGQHAAAACLQVVPFPANLINDLPVYTGIGIGIAVGAFHEFTKELADALFALSIRQDLTQIRKRNGVPADAAQPKVLRTARHRICPESSAAGIIAVVVQSLCRIVHMRAHIFDLRKGVGKIALAEFALEQSIERLGHIQTVQPDLVGIDRLMPEVALKRTGLLPELLTQRIGGLFVLFLTGFPVEREKNAALVDVVKIEFVRLIAEDRAVLAYEVIDAAFGEVLVLIITGDLGHGQQRGHHAAVDIVPAGTLPLPDLFDVPHRSVRGGFADQLLHIGVNLFVHGSPLQKSSVCRLS